MWWYNILNILGYNKGIISHILRLDTITSGSILLNSNLVALKRENSEPILIGKRIEWRKFIDYLVLHTEVDAFRVGNVFIHIWYLPRPSSVKLHI